MILHNIECTAKNNLPETNAGSMYVNAQEPKRFNYILQARWNTPVNEEHLPYQPALTNHRTIREFWQFTADRK